MTTTNPRRSALLSAASELRVRLGREPDAQEILDAAHLAPLTRCAAATVEENVVEALSAEETIAQVCAEITRRYPCADRRMVPFAGRYLTGVSAGEDPTGAEIATELGVSGRAADTWRIAVRQAAISIIATSHERTNQ